MKLADRTSTNQFQSGKMELKWISPSSLSLIEGAHSSY